MTESETVIISRGWGMRLVDATRIIAETLTSALLLGQFYRYRRITVICKIYEIPCKWSLALSILCLGLGFLFAFTVVVSITGNFYPALLFVLAMMGGLLHSLKDYV